MSTPAAKCHKCNGEGFIPNPRPPEHWYHVLTVPCPRGCKPPPPKVRHSKAPLAAALSDVLDERARQDKAGGEQNHDLATWLVILMEEVGEFSKEILTWRFGHAGDDEIFDHSRMREEAVQVAAVALAIVERIDRYEVSP